jgi:hypothetical protein
LNTLTGTERSGLAPIYTPEVEVSEGVVTAELVLEGVKR